MKAGTYLIRNHLMETVLMGLILLIISVHMILWECCWLTWFM